MNARIGAAGSESRLSRRKTIVVNVPMPMSCCPAGLSGNGNGYDVNPFHGSGNESATAADHDTSDSVSAASALLWRCQLKPEAAIASARTKFRSSTSNDAVL